MLDSLTFVTNIGYSKQGATTTARAKVQTQLGGTASIHLEANVPTFQACSRVDVTVTSGTASAQVEAREPPQKLTPRRARKVPAIMSPDD